MSETQSRPSAPRGRGSGRGGRGGHSLRGGRPKQSNNDTIEPTPTANYDEQGEIGQLKKKHALNLMTIREMFPDWTEDDLVFALDETNGDMERTIERMTEGNVSQWGEVKKKSKDRAPAKAQDAHVGSGEIYARGSRTRGGDGARGGRARGTERGRGRGRARDNISGRKPADSAPEAATTVNESWDTPADSQPVNDGWDQPATTTSDDSGWDVVNPADATPDQTAPVAEKPQASSKPDGTRTWASMFAQKPKPKPVVPEAKSTSKAQKSEAPIPASTIVEPQGSATSQEPPIEEAAAQLPSEQTETEPTVQITPSEDQLTESNLQQVPGSPQEPATATVVSNAGTNEIRTGTGSITPVPGTTTTQPAIRPGLGGFQTSALKATTATPRTPSFARRVKEQQEAVVMPGNHAVDRTAVQFGSLGLGSSSADLDAEDDREQPETRAQPPQHSPVAPKASLPAVSQQAQPDSTKVSAGLPAVSQEQTNPGPGAYYNQFGGGYGGYPGQTGESGGPAHKAYEPFGQQASAGAGSLNGYGSHSQAPGQPSQAAHQSQLGGFSSAGNDYSQYYTSDQQRNAYQSMYGSYGQTQGAQDKSAASYGATSASELPATVATSQATHPSQTRFGGVDPSSGHSTPNPQSTTQTQGQAQQAQQVGQGQAAQQAGYPYGSNHYYGNYYPSYMGQHSYGRGDRPPFDDVRRYEEQFLGQSQHYGYGGNHGGYGAPYGGGKYQPHQAYGMPSQAWDGHAGSPANSASYGQPQGTARETASTHGSYGRTGSTQPPEAQQQSSTFGTMPDVFGRSGSYGTQAQTGTGDDASRGYGDVSKPAGPSPAPGRPTSAANVQGQGAQAQGQQAYGSYPGHGQQQQQQQSHYGSGYGHQNSSQGHQAGGYGGYSGFGGSNYYGGNNSRGNWSGNYGH